jgi:hypothetical protein
MNKKQALEIVQNARVGNAEALERFLKIVDALRSQGFNFNQSAKLLNLDLVDFDALIQEAEELEKV